MSMRLLASNAAWSMLSHIMGRGSLIVVAIVLSNKLVANDFATYNYFQLTVSMLATYSALGLGVTASKFFAEVKVVDDEHLKPLGTLWFLSIVLGGGVCFVILLIPESLVSSVLDIPNWLIALGVFSTLIGVVPAGGVLGLEQYRKSFFCALLAAIILIAGVLMLSEDYAVYKAMILFIVSAVVQSVGNSLIVLNQVGLKRIYKTLYVNKESIVTIFEFAGPMLLVSLLASSGPWLIGRIILSGEFGEYQFSLYSIGLQWFSLAMFVPGMISRVVLPRLIRGESLGDPGKNSTMIRQAIILAFGASLLSVILGSLLSLIMPYFYGENYKVSSGLLIFFMIAALPASPANTISNAIIARDGQWFWLMLTCCWFLLILIIGYYTADFGAFSGPIAYFLSYILLTIMALFLAKKMRII